MVRIHRHGMIIGGIVAAVVLVAGIVAAVVTGTEDTDPPTRLVNDWFTAVRGGDATAARQLTCAQSADLLAALPLGSEQTKSLDWHIQDIDAHAATVAIDYTAGGAAHHDTIRYTITQEDGAWKLCEQLTP